MATCVKLVSPQQPEICEKPKHAAFCVGIFINVWIPCTVNMQHSVSCQYPNSFETSLHSNFSNNLFHMKSHIQLQFSVSAPESCMLGCVLLDCSGTK